MLTADLEPESSTVAADPVRALQGLSQLASSRDPPLQAIRLLLTSYSFPDSQETRKRSHDPDWGSKSKDQTGWSCEFCSRSYKNKSSLIRHVNSAHPAKKRLVVTDVFECEECEYTCATQAALEAHIDTHSSSSTDAKSPKYKCALCSKERTSIYHHYGSQHKIDYPEQIMFDTGRVLVRSDINSENGKAPWFLKEKEKIELYDKVTCRLCETKTSFGNPEILADHYTLYHMVEPAMLDNLKRLFRAEKGAHLCLTSSKTPNRQKTGATVKEKVPGRKEETEAQNDKANLKTHAKKSILRHVFDCKECDQVYTTKALLDEHRKDTHGPKTEEKAKTKKYMCTFCRKAVAQIYKHYGNVHNIEYPEQMLFNNGNVLVLADLNTNGGQAPWFLSEKEKAARRYKLTTCRLCETEYDTIDLLQNHYLSEHKVHPDVMDGLNNLLCLFRAAKGVHLVDQPADRPAKRKLSSQQISRPVKESKSKEAGSVHAERMNGIGDDASGLIMYQCAECGVAATTCDASIEHAQLHHLVGGYKPVPLTCDVCSFAFEAVCFADHATHHLSRNEYKIVKFHPSKLLDAWSEMFQGLSESHANRIKASSIYQYTRRVKMNSYGVAGMPLYQCGKCELYVRPKDVEGHCYSKTSCGENQAPGHFCSDCEIYFYSSAGLTEHEKEHRKTDYFIKIKFNCEEDETLNRELCKIQSKATVKEIPVNIQEKKQMIEIEEVRIFCADCKKFILESEAEAHAAMHNKDELEHESNQSLEDEGAPRKQNCLNSREAAPQNVAIEEEPLSNPVPNNEGTVEPWNSDNDSCKSLKVCSYAVRVDVHMRTEIGDVHQNDDVDMAKRDRDIGPTDDVQKAANNPEVGSSSQVQDDIIFDVFSEDMTNELKREIQHLGFKEFGVNMNEWAYIPDDLNPDNFVENQNDDTNSSGYIDSDSKNVETNITQDIFLSYPNVSQIGNKDHEISLDMFSDITPRLEDNVENRINVANTKNPITNINNIVEMSGATDNAIGTNTTNSLFQNDDLQSTSRPSSRVILNEMFSD